MKIPLTNGNFAVIDDNDAGLVSAYRWRYNKPASNKYGYAVRSAWINGKAEAVLMHRLIIGAKKGEIVDHINHDVLDNRRANLRIVNASISCLNRRVSGVRRSGNKFQARICLYGKRISLGVFPTREEAETARMNRAKRLLQL